MRNLTGFWVGLFLSSGLVAAQTGQQIVTPAPVSQAAGGSQSVSFDVFYNTSPLDDTLTGLGLRIHLDSSNLSFINLTNVLPTGLVAQQGPVADSGNQDGSSDTDQVVLVAWSDPFNGEWPGALPVRLFTMNFTTAPDFDSPTLINFSATSMAAGYAFSSTPASVSPGGADLAVSKTAPASAVEGGSLDYSIVVENLGPSTAEGVVLSDPLPAQTTFVSVTSSAGTCGQAGGTVTCNLGDLAPGSSLQVTIDAIVGSVGTVANTVTVTSSTTDPDASNNSATATTLLGEAPNETIPTLSEWGLILLLTGLAGAGWWVQTRRHSGC